MGVFCDEKTFYLNGPIGLQGFWSKANNDELSAADDSDSDDDVDKGCIKIWGGIVGGKKLDLHFISIKIKSHEYVEVLIKALNKMREFGGSNVMLLQDNTRFHKTKTVTDFCERMKILLVDFSPLSPDLNPIENI